MCGIPSVPGPLLSRVHECHISASSQPYTDFLFVPGSWRTAVTCPSTLQEQSKLADPIGHLRVSLSLLELINKISRGTHFELP